MVLLAMTPAIVSALESLILAQPQDLGEPSLDNARVGQPISHLQLLVLAKTLPQKHYTPSALDHLLRGTEVYIPPPPPKPEPVGHVTFSSVPPSN